MGSKHSQRSLPPRARSLTDKLAPSPLPAPTPGGAGVRGIASPMPPQAAVDGVLHPILTTAAYPLCDARDATLTSSQGIGAPPARDAHGCAEGSDNRAAVRAVRVRSPSTAAWQGGGKGVQGAWGAGVQLLPPGPLENAGPSEGSQPLERKGMHHLRGDPRLCNEGAVNRCLTGRGVWGPGDLGGEGAATPAPRSPGRRPDRITLPSGPQQHTRARYLGARQCRRESILHLRAGLICAHKVA